MRTARSRSRDEAAAPASLAYLAARAAALPPAGGRGILGIVGAPGAGKSSLADALVRRLGAQVACYVPMDGFHLAGIELARLGRQQRKGAVDTFDAHGYVALLRRLRDRVDEIVYAPQFRRDLEEPIAGALPIPRDVPLIVTEGNYLLLDTAPWSDLRDLRLLDECWYLDPTTEVRHARLIRRHEAYGNTPEAARAWALGSDERNADLIAASRHRADLVITQTVDLGDDV